MYAGMKMRIDPACGFPADAGGRFQIAQSGHLHAARGAEMVQQGPLSRRTDTLDFVELALAIALDRPARWLEIANRCASSRRRCRKYNTGSRAGSWNGG